MHVDSSASSDGDAIGTVTIVRAASTTVLSARLAYELLRYKGCTCICMGIKPLLISGRKAADDSATDDAEPRL